VYIWVEKMLVDQEYQEQRRKQRGAIRAYLSKVAGLSLAQITRLIRAHARTGKVEAKVYRRQRFAAKYTPTDIALLAQVDRAHERLSRPGRALTRNDILNAVWGNSVMVTPRSIDRCVTTLRAKIESDPHNPEFIRTIRDIGYRFEA
jgi:DNA-binding response OmpR family regulator